MSLLDALERLHDNAARRHTSRDGEDTIVGQVAAVNATGFRCDVLIGADTVATKNIPYAVDLTLTVNDYVYLVCMGPTDYLVVGRANVSVGGAPSARTQSQNLAADVAMTAANTYYDGPAVTLGPGTWLIVATVTISWGNATLGQIVAKLWDGVNAALAGAEQYGGVNGGYYSLALSAIVSPTSSTTYKVSAANAWAGGAIRAATDVNSPGQVASHIRAIRLL